MKAQQMITRDELASQFLGALPDRETLVFDFNVAPVVGVNVALALNAASIAAAADALAAQGVTSAAG